MRNYETVDISDTDSVAELNYTAWDDSCAGDYQNTLGNIQNPPTYRIQNYETDHGSDADSVAELEYKTWEDACARRCRSALVNIPTGLIQNPPTGHIRHYETDDNLDTDSVAELGCKTGEVNVPPGLVQNSLTDIMRAYETDDNSDTDSAAELEDYIGNDTCAWECRITLLRFNQNRPTDISCLMPLIRSTIPLFSDGDGTAAITGYDGGYDGSPAGLLGCLPRRLCSLWVMNVMTQHQMKINGPDTDILVHRTMDDSGRRGVWISDTPPATLTVKGFYLALIDRRASVGGSEGLADWLCMLGVIDNPPGGVWIDFIRRTVGDSQSIVAVPVTGSLVSPTLFSRRDADFSYRYSRCCVNYDTDWILPVGYRVLLKHAAGGAMDADGFSIVDNCAGITFGVELYVPWDAPEMAIDLSSSGTVPLRNVPDVFGISGRRDNATESRILQGKDARSVRVLVPDCCGLDQNFMM